MKTKSLYLFTVHYTWMENGALRKGHTVVTSTSHEAAIRSFQHRHRHVSVCP